MEKSLSVFVDESGNFGVPDPISRFYIVGLVLHDPAQDIRQMVSDLDLALRDLGLPHLYFHAGPLIRREKGYEFMDWNLRRRIFSLMMAFARKVDYRYTCLVVDKRYVSTRDGLAERLRTAMDDFLTVNKSSLCGSDRISVYYDCGQSEITRILHDAFASNFSGHVGFVQGVDPKKLKMFQVADLVCTVKLIELKLSQGISLTESETRFFGGPREFKRNILKKLKAKEL